ncbi:MAG: hypothetical protein DRG33_08070 [Deltaproteobacteria bacterium]|nr:MAG: hypothetical protein DRG33_08070 [Deltaproteobacteria bacterium]
MIIRSTLIRTFKECPAKAHLRYEMGLVRVGEPSVHLTVGKWMHEAIAKFHLEGFDQAAELLRSKPWASLTPHRNKNLQKALSLLYTYARVATWKMEEVERPFNYWLRGYEWRGRFDGLGWWNGDLWIIEHKTSSLPDFQTKPNDQLPLYLLAAHQEGLKVEGILLNLLDFTHLAVTPHPITFTQDELNEWQAEAILVADYYRTCAARGVWPRQTRFCGQCPYLPICSASPEVRGRIIEGFYEVDEEALNKDW